MIERVSYDHDKPSKDSLFSIIDAIAISGKENSRQHIR